MIRLTIRDENKEVLDHVDWTADDQRELIIGREPEVADLVLERGSISAKHCRIRRTGEDTFELEDLDSTNGTQLNNREIERETLTDGDRIMIGDRLVEVHLPGSPSGEAATEAAGAPADQEEDVRPDRMNPERKAMLLKLLRATGVIAVLGLALLLFAGRGTDRSARAEDLYDRMLSAHFRHHHETARSRLETLLRNHPDTPSAKRARNMREPLRTVTRTQKNIREAYRKFVEEHRPSAEDSPSTIRNNLNTLRSKLNVLWADRKSFLLTHPDTAGPFENAPRMTELLVKRMIWITRDNDRFWVRLHEYRQETLHKHLQKNWSNIQELTEKGNFKNALNQAKSVEETFRNSWLHRKSQILVTRTRRSVTSGLDKLFREAGQRVMNGKLEDALSLYRLNQDAFAGLEPLENHLKTLIENIKSHLSNPPPPNSNSENE